MEQHLGNMLYAMKMLRKALDVLPKGPLDPAMDMGVVKILYDQKQDAHEKAEYQVPILERYKEIFDREADRCEENIAILKRDQGAIRTADIHGHYSELIQRHMEQYRCVIGQRKQIMDVLGALRAVIRESAGRQYPGEAGKGRVPTSGAIGGRSGRGQIATHGDISTRAR